MLPFSIPPPRTLLALGGGLGLGIGLISWLAGGPPEVGPLTPLAAIPAEQLRTVQLRPGQTFGEVLEGASVGWNEQSALLLAFREQADPRRMRDGTRITLRWLTQESWLRGIDVTLNSDSTVRLTRDEVGWDSQLVRTPVWVDTVSASGVVQDLLWNAVVDDPELADLRSQDRHILIDWMDRVLQWQVDFSRQVQLGDTYRLVFEREVRPDGSMRSGHLLAVEYVNRGTPYRAIWFDGNGDGDGTFYDEEGKSVRRAFLLKPILFSRISSRYSLARRHPILNTVRAHRGVDFAANAGTDVMATGDGVVIFAGWKGDLGNLVEVRHTNGWITRYGHLRAFARGIRVGSRIRQSDVIGYVGMTGLANGPHVHYEMRRGGQALDPLSINLPPGDPVPTDSWDRWESESHSRLALLEALPGIPILRMAETPDGDGSEDRQAEGGD
jgi:murein DD-endopeptidase MepM/ murein hydrolase activator NlpD